MRAWVMLGLCLFPATAEAQWYLSTYTGINHTLPSTIAINLPDRQMTLDFLDVGYDAKPMSPPQYYGARFGAFLGARRAWGFDVEFLHAKVYARTDEVVHVRGTLAGLAIDDDVLMYTLVERYNHTHGLNFFLANFAWRMPIGSGPTPAAAVMVRAGVGAVRIGRDIVMPGLNVQGYQITGIGEQVGAGLDVRIKGRLSAMAEYKLTYASPQIDLTPGGHGHLTALTHHLTFGISIRLSKN